MTSPPIVDFFAFVAVLVATLAALGIYFALRVPGGEASALAWDRFRRLAERAGVEGQDLEALAAWARRASLTDPAVVLEDRGVFDRFVRDRVYDLDRLEHAPPGSAARRILVENLGALRSKLGHDPRPHAGPLVASRDLLPGIRVTLKPDPLGTAIAPARLVVAWVDEEGIELGPIDDDPAERGFYEAVASGRGLWATFGRPGEATYRFRSRALARPGVAVPSVFIAHGDFLLKEERRGAPRAEHRVPVRIQVTELAKVIEAETVDLSFGGLSLVSREAVARGARLALDLPLETGSAPVPVAVRVLACSKREGGVWFVNAQFADVSAAARGRLQAFLARAKPRGPAPVGA